MYNVPLACPTFSTAADINWLPCRLLAVAASFSVHTISNGLKRDGMPAADIALRISRALDVPLENLLESDYKHSSSFPIDTSDKEEKKFLFNKYYPLIEQLENLPPDTTRAVYTIIEKL